MSNFLVDSEIDFIGAENENADHVEFRRLNQTRHGSHSANKIIRNDTGEIIAIRCNCGEKIYHPVLGDKVFWNSVFLPKQLSLFRRTSLKSSKIHWACED